MTQGSLVAGGIMDAPAPARVLAAALVTMTRADAAPLDGFLISLHSASSPVAARIGREKIQAHHLATVTHALDGKLAGERAALILAVISGLQVMRQMMRLSTLADADENDLVELLAKVLGNLIAPPEGAPGPTPDVQAGSA